MKTFLEFLTESNLIKFPRKQAPKVSVFAKLADVTHEIDDEERAQGFDKAAEWHESLIDKPSHRAHVSPEHHEKQSHEMRRAASDTRARARRKSFTVVEK